MAEVRVDKYLFAMRIYKTRSIAADACKKGRITMNGTQLKPARCFHVGDTFSVRKGPITYSYRVLQLSEKRLGAKLVPDYMRDVTAPDQLELLELARLGGQSGRYERVGEATGHPTKKDRREYETFIGLAIEDWDDELDALEELGFEDEE